jgi:hypothetical protein
MNETFGAFTYRKLCESRAALPPGAKLTPEASVRLIDLCHETWAKEHRVKRKVLLTDEQWLAEISADPANAGLHVFQEHRKYLLWCKSNAKQATRRRFTNWLIRADRLLEGPKELRKPVQEALGEPAGWRAWVDANLADNCAYGSNGTDKDKPWSLLPDYAKKVIAQGMQA